MSSRILCRSVILCLTLTLCCRAWTQDKDKKEPAKNNLTGRYEGTAKNRTQDEITVAMELTEKDGAVSGMIRTSNGDFTISRGSHEGDAVKLQFDGNGVTGAISLQITGDRMSGTWHTDDDGGPVDLKKVAAQSEGPKNPA